jgi:hypothetical protein
MVANFMEREYKRLGRVPLHAPLIIIISNRKIRIV